MARLGVACGRVGRGVILILDANAVVPNPELQGSVWSGIKTAIADRRLTVIVPKVVAAEITGTVRKNRLKQRPKTDGTNRAPGSVQHAIKAAQHQVEIWASQYDAAIWLAADGVVISDTPNVDHDELAQRAINRTPPFDVNGGGYRDSLHWYTVLAAAKEHPTEEIVFISADGGYQGSDRGELHGVLRAEVEAVLKTGSIKLLTSLKDFDPPKKYASGEERTDLDEAHLWALVAALFPGGKLHAPELWMALGLEEPVDADVSEPGDPGLVFAFTRELVGPGRWYRTRIQISVRVAFDWIDWPDDDDESSRQELNITAVYTVDGDGTFDVEEDRTDLQPAPVFTPARTPASRAGNVRPRSRTASAFADWISREFAATSYLATTADKLYNSMAPSSMLSEVARHVDLPNSDLAQLADSIARQHGGTDAFKEVATYLAAQRFLGEAAANLANLAVPGPAATRAVEALADGSQEANEYPEADGSANDDNAQDDGQEERPA